MICDDVITIFEQFLKYPLMSPERNRLFRMRLSNSALPGYLYLINERVVSNY